MRTPAPETTSKTRFDSPPSLPTVICAGAYILDILGRPITALPTTQNSTPIEEIRLTVAGTAGGTAIDLAALDTQVIAVGVIGDDFVGDFLSLRMQSSGINTAHLTVMPGAATSATILPIDTDGNRPAWHVAGANRHLSAAHLPIALFHDADAFHLGGFGALPSLDGPDATLLLRRACEAGLLVTVDCLGVKRPDMLQLLEDALPYVDVFMPNDLEAMSMTGADSPLGAARALKNLGAGAVLVTTGPAGVVGVDAEGEFTIAAHTVNALDSTGCGDAFAAGVIRRLLAFDSLHDAVEFGLAAAALTLQGLGSDGGRLTSQRVAAQMEAEGRPTRDGTMGERWNARARLAASWRDSSASSPRPATRLVVDSAQSS